MKLIATVAAVLCAACGRVGFDALAGDAGDSPGPCGLSDNFNDGNASDWMSVLGTWSVASAGPDTSGALQVPLAEAFSFITHPAISAVTTATVDADFVVTAGANGDFDVLFAGQGWTVGAGPVYFFEVSPIGSDNPEDDLFLLQNSIPSSFDQKPVVVNTGEYHHVTVSVDGSALSLSIDGVPHLAATDTQLAPPYDVLIGFYNAGSVDNISVQCTR